MSESVLTQMAVIRKVVPCRMRILKQGQIARNCRHLASCALLWPTVRVPFGGKIPYGMICSKNCFILKYVSRIENL